MFCPKCARPLAGDVRFCQQCGLALEGLKELVEAADGDGPGAAVGTKVWGMSPRRKGYRRGFILVLCALLILPFFPLVEGLLRTLIPSVENSRLDELPLELLSTALLVLFVAGVARMLYARLFESAEVEGEGESLKGSRLSGATAARQLPPSQSIPVEEFFNGRVKTAELAARPSVTEHTTRSLRAD